ncbi:hypothetical protein Avbf_02930 [Armadillidium vulgare]|nr:hypothetical protein Avbf_02930 [Armadillidium vulgare]
MNSLRYFLFTVSLFVIFGYLDAACPTGFRQIGSKCLQAFPEAEAEATWEEARTACGKSGGYLAYINDCTLMKVITNYLGTTDKDDQFYLHDETCATSLNYLCEADALLAKGEPLKEKTGAQLTECPDDFILISGSCFHFHYDSRDQNTKTSYSDAQTICSNLEARLAVFDDCTLFGSVATYINEHKEEEEEEEEEERKKVRNEGGKKKKKKKEKKKVELESSINLIFQIINIKQFHLFLTAEVQLPSKASYWIGANDIGTDGLWYWDGPYTSLPTGSPFWGSSNGVSEPNGDENQNCAVMYRDNQYYFHDGECYKLAYPLCQLLEE